MNSETQNTEFNQVPESVKEPEQDMKQDEQMVLESYQETDQAQIQRQCQELEQVLQQLENRELEQNGILQSDDEPESEDDLEKNDNPEKSDDSEPDADPEQDEDSKQEPEKHSRTENLTSLLAGVFFVVILAVGAVLVRNGLLIKAKGADESVTEAAQEVSEDVLSSEDVAIVLAEDSLAAQGEATEASAVGEGTGTVGAAGEQAGADDASQTEIGEEANAEEEETDLIADFVDRYGTVIPKNMTSSECIEALAALAEQYPEFEEIYENWEEYPMVLLIALCNNPEMIDFALGYPDADTETAGELTEAEVGSDFPYYLQWDSRWGYLSYGETNIGLSGCGPTCLSMVIVNLTGNAEASPAAVAEYAMEHGYYISGSGTAWSLMTTGAAHFGITGTALSSSISEADLLKLLEEGYPIICSVKPGDFTKGGHFIVLAGVEDGQIRVHDPNSVERSSRLWDYETLIKQVKKMWVFEAAE
ncbi:MAG: C39 family peptidase [Lachnospiraceae bacterium]|nr:C39 family peptidase [Lachnospiraceae bacterium]